MEDERLNCDAIDCRSVDVDWSEAFRSAEDPDECRARLVLPDFEGIELGALVDWLDERDEERARRVQEWITSLAAAECDEDDAEEGAAGIALEWVEEVGVCEDALSPMMNSAYPLPGLGEDEAKALQARLLVEGPCLVVVELDEAYVLALSGGGMDLSWEIAEAHLMAGYWPPAWLRLPDMAGHGSRRVAEAVAESNRILGRWCKMREEDALARIPEAAHA